MNWSTFRKIATDFATPPAKIAAEESPKSSGEKPKGWGCALLVPILLLLSLLAEWHNSARFNGLIDQSHAALAKADYKTYWANLEAARDIYPDNKQVESYYLAKALLSVCRGQKGDGLGYFKLVQRLNPQLNEAGQAIEVIENSSLKEADLVDMLQMKIALLDSPQMRWLLDNHQP